MVLLCFHLSLCQKGNLVIVLCIGERQFTGLLEGNREEKGNYLPLLHVLLGKHLVKCQGSCDL